jgi:hypothetical protein
MLCKQLLIIQLVRKLLSSTFLLVFRRTTNISAYEIAVWWSSLSTSTTISFCSSYLCIILHDSATKDLLATLTSALYSLDLTLKSQGDPARQLPILALG